MDLAEIIALTSPKTPPPKIASLLAERNASLPFMSPQPGTVRWTPKSLNAAGYTIKEGPANGTVVVTTGDEVDAPNTLSHESLHQRFHKYGEPKADAWIGPLALNAVGNDDFYTLARKMRELQPSQQYGPYWGMNPDRNAQEQLASIFGYEGSLPKGTAITDTDLGKQLLSNQRLKDYYFSKTAHPYGGLWEGQVPPPSKLSQLLDTLQQYGHYLGIK